MNKKKKNMKKGVSFFICMIMILSTTMTAFAGSFPLKWTKLSSAYDKVFTFKGDNYKTTASMEKFILDGTTSFCLECGRKINGYTGNDTGNITATYARESASKDSKQNKIAYLGYYSTSQSNKDYAFTQMYIWQSLPDMTYSGNDTVVFTNGATKSEYATWKKGIDSKIATWDTYPSFDNMKYDKVLDVKSGESKTITDSNGVLEDYSAFTYTKGGVTVKHTARSNTLSYSAATTAKTSSVTMTASNLRGAGCQKYTSESVANYVYNSDDDQNMGAYGAVDPLYLNLEFKVTSPTVGTSAIDGETKENIAEADNQVTIIDTVSYKGVIAGKEYILNGVLVDKDTGNPILVDGQKVTASKTFTPASANGAVNVTFKFDGSQLGGKTVVVFESLSLEGTEVATHTDITDVDQTICFPEIGTTAIDSELNDHISFADDEITIIDTVEYKNVSAGKEYKAKGALMDKETGEPLLVNEKPVIAESTFIPEETSGTVEVVFTFDGSLLQGKTLVAFETLTIDDKEIAVHADIEDEAQTIVVPKVGTTATRQGNKIIDTIKYENLIPEKTYIVTGTLMDKDTGKALKLDGKVITVTKEFTPKEASGTVEMTFDIDSVKLAGKTAVVFEEVTLDGKTVAEHKDINDKGQTVVIPELPKEYPDTGDKGMLAVWIILAAASLVIIGRVIDAKKTEKKKVNGKDEE